MKSTIFERFLLAVCIVGVGIASIDQLRAENHPSSGWRSASSGSSYSGLELSRKPNGWLSHDKPSFGPSSLASYSQNEDDYLVPPAYEPEYYPPPCDDSDSRDPMVRNYQRTYTLDPHLVIPLSCDMCSSVMSRIDGFARGYYSNDQRIQWSGQECTFGAEAGISGIAVREHNGWQFGCEIEGYLNQPYDRNILVDSAERRSYRGNFEYESFEISQLCMSLRRGDLLFAMGKFVTPFGRTYFPLYTNNLSDAPFIRTESILWRETGALAQWSPSCFVMTVAITNGGLGRDANSSKALISRVGFEGETCAFGASVKAQDGIGSENQKQYNSHTGIDGMVRFGKFVLSGEAIYDEYGFHRPFDPLDITWGRSIYYRDQNKALKDPITGYGYYLNLDYHGSCWTTSLNYGEFHPEQIGHPQHDVTTKRGYFKFAHHFANHADCYGMYMLENDVENAQAGRRRQGANLLGGIQFRL